MTWYENCLVDHLLDLRHHAVLNLQVGVELTVLAFAAALATKAPTARRNTESPR